MYFEEMFVEGSLVFGGAGLLEFGGCLLWGLVRDAFAFFRKRGSCLDLSYTGSDVFLCFVACLLYMCFVSFCFMCVYYLVRW